MKTFFTFLLFIQSVVLLQAQSIKGIVVNSKDKVPVEYATVALLRPDSSVVTGSTTQTGGKFSFENVKPGNYYIKVSFVGFASQGKSVALDAGTKSLTVDTIFLSEQAKQINEAVVIGKKIEGKELVDRTVYSIPNEVAKESPNAYDLLKKVPSLQVDYNDNITLNGSNNFIIQVDGKQRDKEFLAKIQPSDIESIEVITNPSGRYEGNVEAILNIKLKQEARYGVSGNVNAGARPKAQTSGNMNGSLDYALGKTTFYVTGYGWYNNLNINSWNFSNILYRDSINNASGPGKYEFFVGSINGGVDYYMDKNHSLSFNTSYKPLLNNISSNSDNNIAVASVPFFQNLDSKQRTNSGEINSSLFYRQQFPTPIQELTVEATYYRFLQTDKYTTLKQTFDGDQAPLNYLNRSETNKGARDYFNLKVDYVHPLGMDTRIETGAQLYEQNMVFNGNYGVDSIINEPIANYVDLEKNSNYREWRQAAYLGFTTGADKISFQTNLRVEHSNTSATGMKTFGYSTFLPSANIMYKFNKKHNVKLTYNRRINRPSLTQLSPVEVINGLDIITAGNPGLKPEYRDRFQFTYTLNIDKSYISPYVYYDIYNHKVDNLNVLEQSGIAGKMTTVATANNLLTGREEGIGLNAMIYFININFKFYKGHFNEFYDPRTNTRITAKNYSSTSFGGWAYAPLPWKMGIFAFLSYPGENVNAQGSTINPFFYGTGVRKEFGNHSIGIFYLLPGIGDLTVVNSTVNTPSVNYHFKASFDARYFIQINYAYKFSKGKAAKKVNRNTENESDTKKGLQQ